METENQYDAKYMKKLENLYQHIRKRPGMYLGDTQLRGFCNMIEYLLISLSENRNNETNIILNFEKENKINISILNFDNNKLIEILNNKKYYYQHLSFATIFALNKQASISIKESNQLILYKLINDELTFEIENNIEQIDDLILSLSIDYTIFKDLNIIFEYVCSRSQQFAYLNSKIHLTISDNRFGDNLKIIFHYSNGIANQFDNYISTLRYDEHLIFRLIIEAVVNDYEYQICIGYTPSWFKKQHISTFANNETLLFGGSFEEGIIEGLSKGINNLISEHNKDNPNINKKAIKERLIIFGHIKGKEMIFRGSFKFELGMPNIKKDVKFLVENSIKQKLTENKETLERLIDMMKK
jgi:DNA gyrase/topoisomerase IV subunit B